MTTVDPNRVTMAPTAQVSLPGEFGPILLGQTQQPTTGVLDPIAGRVSVRPSTGGRASQSDIPGKHVHYPPFQPWQHLLPSYQSPISVINQVMNMLQKLFAMLLRPMPYQPPTSRPYSSPRIPDIADFGRQPPVSKIPASVNTSRPFSEIPVAVQPKVSAE